MKCLSSSRFRIFVFNLKIMQIKVIKKCQVAYVKQMKTINQFEGYKTELKQRKGKLITMKDIPVENF